MTAYVFLSFLYALVGVMVGLTLHWIATTRR